MVLIKHLKLKYINQEEGEPAEVSKTKILGITVRKSLTYELEQALNGKYSEVDF